MSYCRFTDDSDIYAYECDGGVQFWVAGRANKALDRLCNTFNEAYQYAKGLRDWHGLKVPGYAIEELRIEALEEAKRISGPGSAVADLQAENAKLRVERDEWHRVAVSKQDIIDHMRNAVAENAKLRELVRRLVYATNPLDRATLIANAAELGIEVDE